DYLNGALDAPAVQEVEEHLAACSECASAAELMRSLKATRQRSSPGDSAGNDHPDASEIAALFFGKAGRARAGTAAHVATCPSCAEEIAEYARAEAAASVYNAADHAAGE